MGNLCLTRREGETVVLHSLAGERIEIEVAEVIGGKVKLLFHAPSSVLINRGEVQKRIDRGERM